jgi:broad specificity phosphatase PhoE
MKYDMGSLLHRLAPELADRDHEFAGLVERYRKSAGVHERARSFQRMFEALTLHWLTASELTGLESWPAFRGRVQRALDRIRAGPGSGRRVVAFTSGGFIGTTVQFALGAPHRSALEVSWRLRNCSLTEFIFSGDRFSLDGFNALPHLEDPQLWTYR